MSEEKYVNGNGYIKSMYENVSFMRDKVDSLEASIERLSSSIDNLSAVQKLHVASFNNVLEHVKGSIPMRFVFMICLIICMAFIGGGILKEITDSHILLKWLSLL